VAQPAALFPAARRTSLLLPNKVRRRQRQALHRPTFRVASFPSSSSKVAQLCFQLGFVANFPCSSFSDTTRTIEQQDGAPETEKGTLASSERDRWRRGVEALILIRYETIPIPIPRAEPQVSERASYCDRESRSPKPRRDGRRRRTSTHHQHNTQEVKQQQQTSRWISRTPCRLHHPVTDRRQTHVGLHPPVFILDTQNPPPVLLLLLLLLPAPTDWGDSFSTRARCRG